MAKSRLTKATAGALLAVELTAGVSGCALNAPTQEQNPTREQRIAAAAAALIKNEYGNSSAMDDGQCLDHTPYDPSEVNVFNPYWHGVVTAGSNANGSITVTIHPGEPKETFAGADRADPVPPDQTLDFDVTVAEGTPKDEISEHNIGLEPGNGFTAEYLRSHSCPMPIGAIPQPENQ